MIGPYANDSHSNFPPSCSTTPKVQAYLAKEAQTYQGLPIFENEGAAATLRLRVAAAEGVRARLVERKELARIPVDALEIYLMKDFLTEAECDALIILIDADRRPSGLLSDSIDLDFRTSESCNLNPHHDVVKAAEQKISAITGIDPTHGETIQGQRYAVGQQFKPHHDFFHTDQPYWAEQRNRGGQRSWTLMVFLNEPAAGGQTNFPEARVAIVPRTGALLMWNNLDEMGEPNARSLHQGTPVTDGVKYIITKWYRERPWS